MSLLNYNDITLQVCRLLPGCERTPIYDGPEYLYTRWRIVCRCLYNPQGTTYDFPVNASVPNSPGPVRLSNLPAQTDVAIRHRLLTPRRQLVLGVGKVAWLVSPQQGFRVDSANGPTPLSCNVVKGPGGRSFVVDYAIETKLRECNLEKLNYPSLFLSHRWQMEHRLDDDFYTTRVIRGHVIFDTARLFQGEVIPDQYRGAFFHPIPPGCQRRIPLIRQHPDGNSVEYVIEDEEQAICLDAACINAHVTRIEASMNVQTEGKGGASLIKGLMQGTLGAADEIGRGGVREIGRGGVRGVAGRGSAWLAAITAVANFAITDAPMQTRVAQVEVWGDAQSTKRGLCKAAQNITEALLERVRVPWATTFTWSGGVHFDYKGRHVIARAETLHTPIVDNWQFRFSDRQVIWPDIGDYSDNVIFASPFPQADLAYLTSRGLSTNARPPGDTKSRGTFLELLVAQGLSDPCEPQYAPVAPPAVRKQDVGFGTGVSLEPRAVSFGPATRPLTQLDSLPAEP